MADSSDARSRRSGRFMRDQAGFTVEINITGHHYNDMIAAAVCGLVEDVITDPGKLTALVRGWWPATIRMG